MPDIRYSLNELVEAAGIEARTIRSYIERGLLPGADTRGRAASYSAEHLSRLEVIKSLRRARPNIGLSEIRIFLEGLNSERLYALASGSITASARALDGSVQTDLDPLEFRADEADEIHRSTDLEQSSTKLTGAQRLVRLLGEISGTRSPTPLPKMEGWQRIAVTPDVELSVRAEFGSDQLDAFRELADLIRHLLQHPDALSRISIEIEP
jgi:DNA-binding transcriptional MerR regulator